MTTDPTPTGLAAADAAVLMSEDQLATARTLFSDYFRHSIYWHEVLASSENWEEHGQYDLGYLGIRLCNHVDALTAERDRYREALEAIRAHDTEDGHGTIIEGMVNAALAPTASDAAPDVE